MLYNLYYKINCVYVYSLNIHLFITARTFIREQTISSTITIVAYHFFRQSLTVLLSCEIVVELCPFQTLAADCPL